MTLLRVILMGESLLEHHSLRFRTLGSAQCAVRARATSFLTRAEAFPPRQEVREGSRNFSKPNGF